MLEGQGFWDRQTRTSGWFITPEDIRERPPTRPRDLFRMIPQVETGDVTGFPGTDGVVTVDCGRGGKFVAYVDGIRVHLGRVWDMAFDVSMNDIAAVEVYPRISTLPIEYNVLGACGAILVWTGQ